MSRGMTRFLVWFVIGYVFAWVITGVVAFADEPTDIQLANQEFCLQNAELARQVMWARQNGVPMDHIVRAFKDGGVWDYAAEHMLRLAYAETLWETEASKSQAITEFGNTVLMVCLEAVSGDE